MPAILSSICSIIIIIAWSKWTEKSDTIPTKHSPRQIYQAWSVYGLIIFFILLAIPFNFKATSLLLFAGAFYRGPIQGITTSRQFTLLGQTLVQIRSTIIMVIALVSISALMEISGMVQLLADTLTSISGKYCAFWSPLVGEIGTFITGSGTSANILFGKLQAGIAANMDIAPSWLAAANTTGTTAGKIISPRVLLLPPPHVNYRAKKGES